MASKTVGLKVMKDSVLEKSDDERSVSMGRGDGTETGGSTTTSSTSKNDDKTNIFSPAERASTVSIPAYLDTKTTRPFGEYWRARIYKLSDEYSDLSNEQKSLFDKYTRRKWWTVILPGFLAILVLIEAIFVMMLDPLRAAIMMSFGRYSYSHQHHTYAPLPLKSEFVCEDFEFQELEDLVADDATSTIALVGPKGVGKTAILENIQAKSPWNRTTVFTPYQIGGRGESIIGATARAALVLPMVPYWQDAWTAPILYTLFWLSSWKYDADLGRVRKIRPIIALDLVEHRGLSSPSFGFDGTHGVSSSGAAFSSSLEGESGGNVSTAGCKKMSQFLSEARRVADYLNVNIVFSSSDTLKVINTDPTDAGKAIVVLNEMTKQQAMSYARSSAIDIKQRSAHEIDMRDVNADDLSLSTSEERRIEQIIEAIPHRNFTRIRKEISASFFDHTRRSKIRQSREDSSPQKKPVAGIVPDRYRDLVVPTKLRDACVSDSNIQQLIEAMKVTRDDLGLSSKVIQEKCPSSSSFSAVDKLLSSNIIRPAVLGNFDPELHQGYYTWYSENTAVAADLFEKRTKENKTGKFWS